MKVMTYDMIQGENKWTQVLRVDFFFVPTISVLVNIWMAFDEWNK